MLFWVFLSFFSCFHIFDGFSLKMKKTFLYQIDFSWHNCVAIFCCHHYHYNCCCCSTANVTIILLSEKFSGTLQIGNAGWVEKWAAHSRGSPQLGYIIYCEITLSVLQSFNFKNFVKGMTFDSFIDSIDSLYQKQKHNALCKVIVV